MKIQQEQNQLITLTDALRKAEKQLSENTRRLAALSTQVQKYEYERDGAWLTAIKRDRALIQNLVNTGASPYCVSFLTVLNEKLICENKAALEGRGGIFDLVTLKTKAELLLKEYSAELNEAKRKYLFYLKEGLEALLNSWQTGTLPSQNKRLNEELNCEMITRLMDMYQHKQLSDTVRQFIMKDIAAQKNALYENWKSCRGTHDKERKEQAAHFLDPEVSKLLKERWPFSRDNAHFPALNVLLEYQREIFYQALQTNDKALGELRARAMKNLREALKELEVPSYRPGETDPLFKLSAKVKKRAGETIKSYIDTHHEPPAEFRDFYIQALDHIIETWHTLDRELQTIIKSYVHYEAKESEENTELWKRAIDLLIKNYRNNILQRANANELWAINHLESTVKNWLEDSPPTPQQIELAMKNLLSAWKRDPRLIELTPPLRILHERIQQVLYPQMGNPRGGSIEGRVGEPSPMVSPAPPRREIEGGLMSSWYQVLGSRRPSLAPSAPASVGTGAGAVVSAAAATITSTTSTEGTSELVLETTPNATPNHSPRAKQKT